MTQPPARSIKAALLARGTLGTPKTESVSTRAQESNDVGTLGTPISNPYAYKNKESITHDAIMCKELDLPVPSVPRQECLPTLTPGGDLIIPFNSPEKYHWWKDGDRLTPDQTRAEIEARNPADIPPNCV